MAAVRQAGRALRRERVFRDRKNPLERFDDHELIQKFRFPRWDILHLTDLIAGSISHRSGRSGAVPALLQVCITLRYLASGCFQDIIGEHLGLHQTTVSRSFRRVLDALVELGPRFIRKPLQEEAETQKRLFRTIPSHGKATSSVRGIILGDSGYPIREWLLTPYQAPQGVPEENYNTSHILLTRNIIERCFGVLKKRFFSLHIGFRLKPDVACKAIYSCFILHNIAVSLKVPLIDDPDQVTDDTIDIPNIQYQTNIMENAPERARTEAGKAVRYQITRTFFS